MPRPKGSKNKRVSNSGLDLAAVQEKISSVQNEIEELASQVKQKKLELKSLLRDKIVAEEAEERKKAEEEKVAILAAFQSSGKTMEEVLNFLK